LNNPGNGVYDITEYPKWPRTAVSIEDFYLYLRGRDGNDGKDGEDGTKVVPKDTMYVEEADLSKYNVVPVRALAKVKENKSVRDTTYEYANPYTGGCYLAVTGPGPVLLQDCTVSFKDQAGNSYRKTSDAAGYIYLKRDELPVWKAGSPSVSEMSSRTRPESFEFNGKTITDPDRIAATCGVPYQVGVSVTMLDSGWRDITVSADYRITRVVEGTEESSWGGYEYPYGSTTGLGYFYYRNPNDLTTLRNMTFISSTKADNCCVGDRFVKFLTISVENEWGRFMGDVASEETETVAFGDGSYPEAVGIHYLPVSERRGTYTYRDHVPDYGLGCVSEEKTIIPEYCSIGGLDVSGAKGGDGDEPYTSFNGKLVMSDDGTSKVLVNNTNYELILGQTSFSFSMDYSTFGHVYLRESYYDEDTKTFRFKRYDTLLDYLEDTAANASQCHVMTFDNNGTLGGVSINNRVNVYFDVSDGKITDGVARSFIIRNVYDGFTVKFGNFIFEDVFYAGLCGTFSYNESDPYVASCTLGETSYAFQAIKDAKSAPLQ